MPPTGPEDACHGRCQEHGPFVQEKGETVTSTQSATHHAARALVYYGIVIGLGVMLVTGLGAAQDPAIGGAVTNPHWTKDGCGACHTIDEGKALPIPIEQIERLCLSCHDGVKAGIEPHPVGRLFAGENIVKPDGWPAPDNRVTCVTCHELDHPSHMTTEPPEGNRNLLRGGGALSPQAFCAKCHVQTEEARFNPHMMLNSSNEPLDDRCLFCHTGSMTHSGTGRSGDPKLRTAEPVLCLGCHTTHVDFFDPGHTGTTVRGGRYADQARRSELPLRDGHLIVCSTCHNPHQAGLFESGTLLARGGIVPGRTSEPVALRRPPNTLCKSCHEP